MSLPPEAHAQQFALSREIEAARFQVAMATAETATLQKGLGEGRATAKGKAAHDIDARRARLTEISGVAESVNPGDAWQLQPRTLTSLHYLAGVLERLAAALDGADAAPTPDARKGVAQTTAALRATLAAWDKLKAQGVPRP